MELELTNDLAGGTYGYFDGQYGYMSTSGQFSPMSPATAPEYQPPSQSGFVTFLNDFLTPQTINAIGGLFTKKPQQFNTPEDFGKERNFTGILVVSIILIALIVLVIVAVRKKK